MPQGLFRLAHFLSAVTSPLQTVLSAPDSHRINHYGSRAHSPHEEITAGSELKDSDDLSHQTLKITANWIIP
ncbi:MAG: hypothetical protein AVO34_00070 [Firmicutes bacterium ML8_F2]|jgi:hypothetical protein|nr:MAG: hypothetical protein AVO34_00070 [Firmicutes bacterium ML8_F2]